MSEISFTKQELDYILADTADRGGDKFPNTWEISERIGKKLKEVGASWEQVCLCCFYGSGDHMTDLGEALGYENAYYRGGP